MSIASLTYQPVGILEWCLCQTGIFYFADSNKDTNKAIPHALVMTSVYIADTRSRHRQSRSQTPLVPAYPFKEFSFQRKKA